MDPARYLPAWFVLGGAFLGWLCLVVFICGVVGWNVAKHQIRRERKRNSENRVL